ncbi:oxidoreductase [Planotetraspora thailandica]|uniref:Oxidoreductase n=1 Tax=Planotetraspora thailandica TaxID=487172 RepID=A0A8J3V779_9ACTN|nr:oxidoreductase [Planotetraspora thailandica]GII57968.1 oxidoreductase [Planotetraspora thailandica]
MPLQTITLAEDLTITRMGYGAMQLAGPNVFGEPRDRAEALAVLREAVESGVTHIDTADFYGPVITNRLIEEALHPYDGITIATKVGARRGEDGAWISSLDPKDLQAQVHDNLDHLGVDALDLVYLRLGSHDGTTEDSLEAEFTALAELRQKGLIKHLGLSGVSSVQLTEAQGIAPVVAIQNLYNLVNRQDDELVARAARENIAFASFFPLGGFSPLQSDVLHSVAARLGASPQQVALAWLLQRSSTSVVIPGTSSRGHLRENIAAADLVLPADAVAELDAIGTQA